MAVVAAVFVTLGFDYVFRMERPLRVGLMLAAAAALAWIVARQLAIPLCRRMDERSLALLVESRFSLQDRLISTVDFSSAAGQRPEASPEMLDRLAQEAAAAARPLDFHTVLERHRLRRVAMICASCIMLLTGFTVWQQPLMALWFQRNVQFSEVD
jgi:hypothetical protein